MARKDIEFRNTLGVTLRGWLYTPSDNDKGLPCLVMEHGFSAVKEMGLDAFAEVFIAQLRLAVLIYDNRGFGASDTVLGQPRLEIIPSDQISDFQDAITYAQSLPEVNPKRVGIWGSSYAGGNALVVAATDRRVKAVISQVSASPPFLCSLFLSIIISISFSFL
jgi:cephalosporin-C deacetylase-like acetyl esterase